MLRKHRLEREWTQEFVAKKIGVNKVTIHDLETGKRMGSIKVWDALEDLFQVSQRQLRENIGAASPEIAKKPGGNQAK